MQNFLKNKFLFSTVLAVSAFGYSGRSYAGTCDPDGPSGTYTCSGAGVGDEAGVSITVSGVEAEVTTDSGFGIGTSASPTSGVGIYIQGDTGITFDGTNGADIYADNGGIQTRNSGGATNIILTSGTIDSYNGIGIDAKNYGTDLSITSSSAIIGGQFASGIYTDNQGMGSTTINLTGGSVSAGIFSIIARNRSTATDISITSSANISGNARGIYADNQGMGSTTINVTGGTVSSNAGIFARNRSTATDLSITINSSANITAAGDAIYADNYGSGATTITISGSVSGNTAIRTDGNAATINLNDGATITGNSGAITTTSNNDFVNISGAVTIDGDVDGGSSTDTFTVNSGASLTFVSGGILNFETFNFNGLVDLGGGTLTLASGQTLAGNTTITGDITAGSGATIAPGNSIGTITVTGDVTLDGSTLDIETSGGSADLITATGTISIDGTTINLIPFGTLSSGTSTILHADTAITGTPTIDDSALTGTSNVTTVITTFDGTDTVDNTFNDSNNLRVTLEVVAANLSTVDANIRSTINTALLFSDTLADETAAGAFAKDRRFWARAVYRNQNANTAGSYLGFSNNISGIALGAQLQVGFDAKDSFDYNLGFAFSSMNENLDVKRGQGSKDGQAFFVSFYGTAAKEFNPSFDLPGDEYVLAPNLNFFTSLAVGFGYHNSNNQRLVDGTVLAKSTSNDLQFDTTLQTGVKIKDRKENWYIMPRISASYIHTFGDKFSERTGGTSAIAVGRYDFDTLKLRESVRFGFENSNRSDKSFLSNNFFGVEFSPYFEIGFAQERALNNRNISGRFLANGEAFNATLAKNDRNFFNLAIGTDIKINEDTSAFVNYERSEDFSNEGRNDVQVGVRVKF